MKKEFRAIALILKSALSYIWDVVFTPASDEPRIHQRLDHYGEIYWRVYDPTSNRSIVFYSEQEVRKWLDQRFFHR